jgi:ABC-type oligopeptide transport system substrate-binding subunit
VSGKITVTTPAGSGTSAGTFVVALLPKVTSFSPTAGPIGTVVTVTGVGLDAITDATFAGTPVATLVHVSATQVKLTVPPGAVTGPVAVGGPGGSAASTASFKVTPKITGFSPASGARGSAVELDGSGFTGATKVQFGTAVATDFAVSSDTRITAIVPATAVTGKIAVTTPSGSSASVASFTVSAAAAPKVLHVNMSATDVDFVDPARAYGVQSWQLLHAVCANLVTYGDGSSLVLEPEVAGGLPDVSADGLTYTFHLRNDFHFAPPSNKPVTAQSFKDEIDRLANPAVQSPAATYISNIAGVAEVLAGSATSVSGVVANGDTLTITLLKPEGDFLGLLALPWFCAVPPGTPATELNAFASAGPFSITSRAVGSSIVLKRNAYYPGDRPISFDEIDYTVNTNADHSLLQMEAGLADYDAGGVAAGSVDGLWAQYGPGAAGGQQLFEGPLVETDYLALNTSRATFSDPRVRKAVNFAIDRPALIAARGSTRAGTPTDQFLPPGMPGFRDADIYPLDGPDLDAAQAALPPAWPGATVTMYTNTSTVGQNIAAAVQAELAKIGITVQIQSFQGFQLFVKCGTKGEPFDICLGGWNEDYPDPDDFLQLLDGATIKDTGNNNLSYFNDPTFNQRIADAYKLAGADRFTTYGDLDVDIAHDAAPLANIDNRNSFNFFSSRIGCQTYQPVFGTDLATLCLK